MSSARYLSSADVERLYPARVARIARGELTYAERGRINEEVSRIDREWRVGHFNGVEYFHFRFPEQGARMAAFLMKQRLHRLVPESSEAPTAEEVDAAWARLAEERETILAWARSTRMLIEIVQAYRFERRQGACSRPLMPSRRKWSRRRLRRSTTRRPGRACASNGPSASIANGSGAARGTTRCCNAAGRSHMVIPVETTGT